MSFAPSFRVLVALVLLPVVFSQAAVVDAPAPASRPHFVAPGEFRPSGDLADRLQRNFDRLEEEKYRPENVFQREKEFDNWPGDTEGRTVLALVLLARTTGRTPQHLDAILQRWPQEVNPQGYFGKIHLPEAISEQQLASHGWVLRALSELERWRPNGPARGLAQPIIDNLIRPTAGAHRDYPLDPSKRHAAGSYSGSYAGRDGRWLLSTDVGCNFICLDGLVDAYDVFRDQRLRPIIEEMIGRFLQLDLVAARVQTHATLTACRALLRWAELTGDASLVSAVAERYDRYTHTAWTEHYANYNWFGRPEWTEACAVVDSLMVAMDLWRLTGRPEYVEQAQLIYFNALGHAQRSNGGFGCDNCPGADGSHDVFFKVFEAHWCCSMRGGEGLSRLGTYGVARAEERWLIPFWFAGELRAHDGALVIDSEYPFAARARLRWQGSETAKSISLFVPAWLKHVTASDATGKTVTVAEGERWLELPVGPAAATWTISGELQHWSRPVLAHHANAATQEVRFQGPLLLGTKPGVEGQNAELVPIFTAFGDPVSEPDKSHRRILFDAVKR